MARKRNDSDFVSAAGTMLEVFATLQKFGVTDADWRVVLADKSRAASVAAALRNAPPTRTIADVMVTLGERYILSMGEQFRSYVESIGGQPAADVPLHADRTCKSLGLRDGWTGPIAQATLGGHGFTLPQLLAKLESGTFEADMVYWVVLDDGRVVYAFLFGRCLNLNLYPAGSDWGAWGSGRFPVVSR